MVQAEEEARQSAAAMQAAQQRQEAQQQAATSAQETLKKVGVFLIACLPSYLPAAVATSAQTA